MSYVRGVIRLQYVHGCLSECFAEQYAYHMLPQLAMQAIVVTYVKAAHGTEGE